MRKPEPKIGAESRRKPNIQSLLNITIISRQREYSLMTPNAICGHHGSMITRDSGSWVKSRVDKWVNPSQSSTPVNMSNQVSDVGSI